MKWLKLTFLALSLSLAGQSTYAVDAPSAFSEGIKKFFAPAAQFALRHSTQLMIAVGVGIGISCGFVIKWAQKQWYLHNLDLIVQERIKVQRKNAQKAVDKQIKKMKRMKSGTVLSLEEAKKKAEKCNRDCVNCGLKTQQSEIDQIFQGHLVSLVQKKVEKVEIKGTSDTSLMSSKEILKLSEKLSNKDKKDVDTACELIKGLEKYDEIKARELHNRLWFGRGKARFEQLDREYKQRKSDERAERKKMGKKIGFPALVERFCKIYKKTVAETEKE